MSAAAAASSHERARPLVCAVGTTDPWNAAGLGLDVAALAACGARALIVVAGVSAQDGRGLHAARALAPELIAAQFTALADAPIAAYRIGALLDVVSIRAVAAALSYVQVPIVYDPVLGPSAGGSFSDDEALAAIRTLLLPRVTLATPNAAEAARLCERAAPRSLAEAESLATALVAGGPRSALVTGFLDGAAATDVLADGTQLRRFPQARVAHELRGSGCLLADALAAALAHGQALGDAVLVAQRFVADARVHARELAGMRVAF